MGRRQGQAQAPGALSAPAPRGGVALDVARRILGQHADRLPDLSGVTVLVPNHRAGQDFARILAGEAGRAALIPPRITPLTAWAEGALVRHAEPRARRLARLHGVLRHQAWLGTGDKWALANELLELADELTGARLGGAVGARLRALQEGRLDRETALVEAVWQALNGDGGDPQSVYAAALDALLAQLEADPHPVYGYALGRLTAIEQRFFERCAGLLPLTLVDPAIDADPAARVLHTAWRTDDPPLAERAAALARELPASPVRERIRLAPAPHLEAEARMVVAWVAEQLHAGRRAIALIAFDREAARRIRALLERMDVLVADETGWKLSTAAATAVVDRWLECIAGDFPHVALLDLLKSPFLLGDPAARQDDVLAFELAMRRRGVSQGAGDLQRLAHHALGALPPWLAPLFDAAQAFPLTRSSLAGWLARLEDSLARIGAWTPLGADAAGAELIGKLVALRRELAGDPETYSFSEWRRWLDVELESANFPGANVASPVVLTSLPAARGRVFEAVAVIGADGRNLPPRPAAGLFSQATRAQLGLPTAEQDADVVTGDLLQLLVQGPALLSWQAWRDDEPNPASPLVQRLQALHQATWGAGLAEQAAGEPPVLNSVRPTPSGAPAPRVPASQLPRRYSASAYQTLLDCPYRFFAVNVLGLRELDEADDALDKSDYGNALHRILKRFHDSDPPFEQDAALDRLQALSAAEFAALPAYTAAAWSSRWAPIQAGYVNAWLAWAASGWRCRAGEAELAAAHDVDGLGEVILHGRADRIDWRPIEGGGEARQVFDYKTSTATALRKKLKNPTETVQLPFYAWLADAAAAYLPIGETPVTALMLGGEADVEAIARRLPALLAEIAAGAGLPAAGIDAVCRYCEGRGLCRKGTWDEVHGGPG